MHFERELRSRLLALSGVTEATVVRDLAYDWMPEMMTRSGRARLEQRRARLYG